MHVAKWGNSLAVRLPKALVDRLGLSPGDVLDVVAADKRSLEVVKIDVGANFAEEAGAFRWPTPNGYKFDRDEANAR